MLKSTPEGFCFLNLGCGDNYSREWNNLDLYANEHVVFHDLLQPLPYPDNTFDAVYSSHVLEHLTPTDGERLVQQAFRVLKPGGIIRIAVPDLEAICREYLTQLDALSRDQSETNLKRYYWIKLELIDQMVRTQPGGLMLETLRDGSFDRGFVEYRNGDLVRDVLTPAPSPARVRLRDKTFPLLIRGVIRKLRSLIAPPNRLPPVTGEAHRWMYDRCSLQLLLEAQGFTQFSVTTFDQSRIPYWHKYNLDHSRYAIRPRKPDSVFVEAEK